MEEHLDLKCEECNVDYKKPKIFKEYSEGKNPSHFFYKRCLKYCDKCRRAKENEMLKNGLHKVIEALSKPQ